MNDWHEVCQREGKPGLKGAGRKPKLTPAQLAQAEQELLRGLLAQGHATISWTLPRIALSHLSRLCCACP